MRNAKNQPKPKLAAHVSTTASKCSLCDGDYYLARCPEFASKTIIKRREVINTKRLCYNCLGAHKLSECRTPKRYRMCNSHHHTMIHLANANQDTSLSSGPSANATSGGSSSASVNANTVYALQSLGKSLTLLATAIVNVIGAPEATKSMRVLLDQRILNFPLCTNLSSNFSDCPAVMLTSRSSGSDQNPPERPAVRFLCSYNSKSIASMLLRMFYHISPSAPDNTAEYLIMASHSQSRSR